MTSPAGAVHASDRLVPVSEVVSAVGDSGGATQPTTTSFDTSLEPGVRIRTNTGPGTATGVERVGREVEGSQAGPHGLPHVARESAHEQRVGGRHLQQRDGFHGRRGPEGRERTGGIDFRDRTDRLPVDVEGA